MSAVPVTARSALDCEPLRRVRASEKILRLVTCTATISVGCRRRHRLRTRSLLLRPLNQAKSQIAVHGAMQ